MPETPNKSNKFKKLEKLAIYNPVDWFNSFGEFMEIFKNSKPKPHVISDCVVAFADGTGQDPKLPTFRLKKNGFIDVLKTNPFNIGPGIQVSKFMLLSACRFKGNDHAAMSFVDYFLRKREIPYLRVGSDYYKAVKIIDRWGGENLTLKAWKKQEINQDHGNKFISYIHKYDDFAVYPDNKTYTPVVNSCYNLYSKFPHEEYSQNVTAEDIPHSLKFVRHIFGVQYELGLKYMKVLYDHPKQILPILVLVSEIRGTGKTTHLNWNLMLFGGNAVLISPSDLNRNFNSQYASKNIIMMDETALEKSDAVEKLKSIATAKTISVSQKHVSEYSIPFFGKAILATNREIDFLRIDNAEIRFWVRRIPEIDKSELNTNLEDCLFNEIPKFLKYLSQLPEIDLTKSRMVFTSEEISTVELADVKSESRSSLYKELELHIEEFFNTNACQEFFAAPIDIKDRWFKHNNQITGNYIGKVIKTEMKIQVQDQLRYRPFGEGISKPGTPFKFVTKSLSGKERDNFDG
ncbi:MAG: primase-helicase family protein [Bacteroidia bacterium]